MFVFLLAIHSLWTASLADQFMETGYLEICDESHGSAGFDSLYRDFDRLIEFLQMNPSWAQRIYLTKERFIRSKIRSLYSTDIFGYFDESIKTGRKQISFYYSTHFHEFICLKI